MPKLIYHEAQRSHYFRDIFLTKYLLKYKTMGNVYYNSTYINTAQNCQRYHVIHRFIYIKLIAVTHPLPPLLPHTVACHYMLQAEDVERENIKKSYTPHLTHKDPEYQVVLHF